MSIKTLMNYNFRPSTSSQRFRRVSAFNNHCPVSMSNVQGDSAIKLFSSCYGCSFMYYCNGNCLNFVS